MRRRTALAASVLAAGIVVGGGVGIASAFDQPGHPTNTHSVGVQIQQHRAPTNPASVAPGTVRPGDGVCDGTCDQVQSRDRARDGTCDRAGGQQQPTVPTQQDQARQAGTGQQTAAHHGEPMHQQEPAHHTEPVPHHGDD